MVAPEFPWQLLLEFKNDDCLSSCPIPLIERLKRAERRVCNSGVESKRKQVEKKSSVDKKSPSKRKQTKKTSKYVNMIC